MQTKELEKPRKPVGIIAKLAATYEMNAADFEMMLVRTIFPKKGATATKEEVAALCVVASEYGLNPITKQIYAFPNKQGGITPIIGVDGWYALANRDPHFDGLTFNFAYNESEEGKERRVPHSCTATIYRDDRAHPVVVTEFYFECYRDTPPWNNQPHRMLRHRATIQAIRLAFGIAGLDPEDAERIPEYEAQAGQVVDVPATPRVDSDTAAKELGDKYAKDPAGPKDGDTLIVIEKEYPVNRAPDPEPTSLPSVVGHVPQDVEPEDPFDDEASTEEVDRSTGEVRTRAKRRTRAVTEQRDKFAKAMSRGWIDPGLIAVVLPDVKEEIDGKVPADDSLEAAFAIMWSDDAEAVLEKIKAGRFKPEKVAETAPEPPDGAPGGEEEPEPGGAQDAFPV